MLYILIITALLFGVALLLKMISEARRNDVIHQMIYLQGFPKSFNGTKIFFISDIHKREISDEIIKQVKGKVDFVIIAGDLTEQSVPLKQVDKTIEKLASVGPTYFVWGNNDYETNYRDLDASLLKHGVKILDNTSVTFHSENEEEIHLLGLDDMSRNRDNLQLALNDSKEGFKILVCHDPKIDKLLTKDQNIRLLLAGHTHGGQIRLFGWGIAPKAGVRERDFYTEFISNGYGTSRIPLRLGAPAQTHILELHSK
jgi:uncharacterized protein